MLTWYDAAETLGIRAYEALFQRATANALRTNQNQRLSVKRRHARHFLVDEQITAVELVRLARLVHHLPLLLRHQTAQHCHIRRIQSATQQFTHQL